MLEPGSEQLAAVWDWMGGCDKDDAALLVRKPKRQNLRHEFADLPGREIHHCGDLAADEAIGRVMFGNLCRASLEADFWAEIDYQLDRGPACLRIGGCLFDGADADIHRFKIGVA